MIPNIDTQEIKTPNKQFTGKITHLNNDKGYGFISSKDIPFERIFFHFSWVNNTSEKKFIDFKVGMSVKGEAYSVLVKDKTSWRGIKIESI